MQLPPNSRPEEEVEREKKLPLWQGRIKGGRGEKLTD